MSVKYLSYHWFIGGVRKLNTLNGKSRRSFKYKWLGTPDKGTAWKQGMKWFYSYEHLGVWYLQHKKHRWVIDSNHQFKVKQLNLKYREFMVFVNERQVFVFKYKVKGYKIKQFDVTYDDIDAQTDDFFLEFVSLNNN